MQNEIRTMKEALYEEIETLIFTRFQEFSSMRYEHRMEALNAAVEALKIEVVQLREKVLRSEAVPVGASPETGHGPKPNPVTGAGSAPVARGSAPTIPPPRGVLDDVATELSQTLRQLNERLDSQTRNEGRTQLTNDSHEKPAPFDEDPPRKEELWAPEQQLGPPYPGLEPLRTLQNPFVRAVSYQAYRLEDTREDIGEQARIHKRAAALRESFPHITNFSGRMPTQLLSFLQQFKAACDFSGIHEGLAVRVVSFFFEGDAHRFYLTQTTSALRSRGAQVHQLVWPVLVHKLLKRYCSEDALAKAYDKVTRARQRDTETEGEFADRIHEAAIECGDVFDENTLVNHYISGLLPTVKYAVSEAIIRHEGDVDMSVARRIATAAGETHRAQKAATKPRTRATTPTMLLDSPPMNVPPPTTKPYEALLALAQSGGMPTHALGTPSSTTASSPAPITEAVVAPGQRGRPTESTVSHQPKNPPPMSDADMNTALQMMTRKRGGLRCWGCREDGHDLYNCPYVPYEVRLLFAKSNYDYQAETLGPEVADQHLRIRGYSPSRMGNRRREKYPHRGVSIASPAVSAVHPNAQGGAPKRVLIAQPPDEQAQPRDDMGDDTSSSSGN